MASWQITDILRIYFDRPFKWNYYTKLPDQVHFPISIFCTDRLIDGLKVRTKYPDIFNSTTPDEWSELLTVGQQFEASVSAPEFFYLKSSKMTTRETMRYERIDRHFAFMKYINYQHVCFKTFSEDTRVNPLIAIRSYKRSLFEMMQYANIDIRLREDRLRPVKMMVQFDGNFALNGYYQLLPGSQQNIVFPITTLGRLLVDKYIVFHRIMKLGQEVMCKVHT